MKMDGLLDDLKKDIDMKSIPVETNHPTVIAFCKYVNTIEPTKALSIMESILMGYILMISTNSDMAATLMKQVHKHNIKMIERLDKIQG